MLYVLHGGDDFRLEEALSALRIDLDADSMLATNSSVLEGRRLTPAELLQHASALPFLGSARLVLVDGLLAAAGRGRAVVERWQPLLDALPTLPPSTTIVLRETPPKRARSARGRPPDSVGGSPLLTALKALEGVEVREFRPFPPNGRETESWLRERAGAAGVAIEPRALATLVELVGPKLRILDGELTKLARYAGERPITEADVRLLTPEAREQSVFRLIDAAVEGEGAEALRILDRMLAEGSEAPSRVQFQLARQLGQLVRAAECAEAGGDEGAIGEATGASGYARTKLVRQARATSRAVAEAALRAVERADHAVKSGRMSEALSLELLLVDVAALARTAVPAGSR